ncbi:DUF4062 domain-containing protein [Pseudomonas nitroreducens]|uniref:DUF4062 domain-containing protein n=1 Tax=Pseudomonas nitroreducens TaxID=46680 RepID=UPI0023F79EF4|nr:DUF4062 domain-containing protein [Pseudomonas nitroreducens]WEW98424.1 DUF4062 domain-containing protein [Pseudomonas nitroreducens]
MSNDKRYQVFVSSTYEDLREERQEVMQALLELDCIPAGMELFPATDDDQWTLIRRVIDECDYYILIMGGRYGSIGPQGISYTEQEYRYAVETGKPVVAFLHKSPEKITVGKSEKLPESIELLRKFRELAQTKTCKFWDGPSELGSVVSRSIIRLISTHPMPGWIRADKAATAVAAAEVLRLREIIEELRSKLEKSKLSGPTGSEELAQGNDLYPIEFKFEAKDPSGMWWEFSRQCAISWSDLFEELGPLMMDEADDMRIKQGLSKLMRDWMAEHYPGDKELKGFGPLRSFSVVARDEDTIKIQFRALGLIERSSKARSVKDTRTFWSLTPYGDATLVKLRAIKKGDFDDLDVSR